jgi:hypothetical protein
MGLMAVLAAAASVSATSSMAIERQGDPLNPGNLDYLDRRRGKGQNNRRGKGKRSPPKARPNRLTISKRVRRKHRRAAK